MPLTIDDPEIDRMAEELARREGVGVAQAVKAALAARLAVGPKRRPGRLKGEVGMTDDFDATPKWLIDAFEGKGGT